jgi:tetrapyrrole methylase family protein / MazG family protein
MYPHWKNRPESETDWFEALANLARHLRGPDGCPWDQEQKAHDFARFAREEAEEMAEAFDSGDNSHIEEEWGDTFFVLLAAAAAAEHEGLFSLRNALERAHEKMIRRHDHVFGDNPAANPEEAIERWNAIKAREKGN